MKYVAEIPARLGSKRVQKKNLRLIAGKPMIQYSIEACKTVKELSEIYVNSDADIFKKIADENGINFYRRPQELCQDHIVSDQFNYDFLMNIDCDAVVMVNPVSPLVTAEDISGAIHFFNEGRYDSVISIKNERLHSFFKNDSLNFDKNSLLPMTQNIDPVQICVWSVCVWRKETFLEYYEKNGHAVFHGNVGLYPINPINAIKVSYEEDFNLVEYVLEARNAGNKSLIEYYE